MSTYPIKFVSLGPGDHELITLQALRTLQEADLIYYPALQIKDDRISSRALDIMQRLEIDVNKTVAYVLPMIAGDRGPAMEAYRNVSEQSVKAYAEGKRIVFVAEGDASFYSSFAYVRDYLLSHQIPMQTLPGVPAFLAAAASINMPFLRLEEELHVMPAPKDLSEMQRALDRGELILLMKLSKSEQALKGFIAEQEGYSYVYFENVSCQNAFQTSDKTVILERSFPYFSMLLIRRSDF